MGVVIVYTKTCFFFMSNGTGNLFHLLWYWNYNSQGCVLSVHDSSVARKDQIKDSLWNNNCLIRHALST